MSDDKAVMNTDREIWRERPDDFYADSIHVTEGNGIGLNVGGHVIVKPIRDWFKLAVLGDGEPSPSPEPKQVCPQCQSSGESNSYINGEGLKMWACGRCFIQWRPGAAQEVSPPSPEPNRELKAAPTKEIWYVVRKNTRANKKAYPWMVFNLRGRTEVAFTGSKEKAEDWARQLNENGYVQAE